MEDKMTQNHILMGDFSIEKYQGIRYDSIIKYYDVEAHMKKQYEDLMLKICIMQEDIVRTSVVDDPFDDDYQDSNIQFNQ